MKVESLFSVFVFLFFSLSCQKEKITLSSNADDHIFVESDGASMPVWMKGNTASGVILIFVHGGPGGSSMSNADASYMIPIQESFGVAYWDQRSSGSSQGNSNKDLTIDQYSEDLKMVINVLKKRYGSSTSIFLLAHSWGGTVSTSFLTKDISNQQLIKGWICMDGAFSPKEIFEESRKAIVNFGTIEIAQNHKIDEWQPMVDYCNNNFPVDVATGLKINEMSFKAESLMEDVYQATTTSGINNFNPNNITANIINQYATSHSDIIDEMFATSFIDKLNLINVPTLALWGKYDFTVPAVLADTLAANIGTSEIINLILPHSGHSCAMNEPELFSAGIISFVNLYK